jgi:hypothetical protein
MMICRPGLRLPSQCRLKNYAFEHTLQAIVLFYFKMQLI